jgi:hypothetical protein
VNVTLVPVHTVDCDAVTDTDATTIEVIVIMMCVLDTDDGEAQALLEVNTHQTESLLANVLSV